MKYLYKIIVALFVLAMIPTLLFLPVMEIATTSDILDSYLDEYGLGTDPTLMDVFTAVENLIATMEESDTEYNLSWDVVPEIMRAPLIAFIIFLALTVLLAILTLIMGLFTKKYTLTGCFAAGGLLSAVITNYCFDKTVIGLIDGRIDLLSLYTSITGDSSIESMYSLIESISSYSSTIGSVISSLVGDYDLDIRILELSTAHSIILVLFGAVVLVTILYKAYLVMKTD